MIGAGVFAAFGPAAAAAGSGLLIGLVLAAAVAGLQRRRIRTARRSIPDVGRLVRLRPRTARRMVGLRRGLGFVVGKTASCAAMALTFGAYAVDWTALAATRHCACRGDGPCRSELLRDHAHRPTRPGAGDGITARLVRPDRGHRDERPCKRVEDRRAVVVRRRRPLRDVAGSRAALLRVRRLRTDCHARRGSARSRADDPEGDPDRACDHGRDLSRGCRDGARRRRARGARVERSSTVDRGRRGRRSLGLADRARRRCRREPRCPPRVDCGNRPDCPRDGPKPRPASLARFGASSAPRARPRRADRRGGRRSAGAVRQT